MSFLVIIVCLLTQWFVTVPLSREWNWVDKYLALMRRQFFSLTHDYRLSSFVLLTLPPVIVLSFLFTLTYHLFGHIGYSMLSLVLLWYCMDITFLKQVATTQIATNDLFIKSYQKIFALLFWYFIFGPGGLILYIVVSDLRKQLMDQKYFALTQGILDWVPIRLLGLSFALAGNFGIVFKEWLNVLFQPISDNQSQAASFGKLALAADGDVTGLIRRTLIIWLIVMGLITLGSWMG